MIYKEDFEFNLLTDEELDQLINLVKEEQKERRATLKEQYSDELRTLSENIKKASLKMYYVYDKDNNCCGTIDFDDIIIEE